MWPYQNSGQKDEQAVPRVPAIGHPLDGQLARPHPEVDDPALPRPAPVQPHASPGIVCVPVELLAAHIGVGVLGLELGL